MKQTSNTEHRTPNTERPRPVSEFDVRRSTLGVGRLLSGGAIQRVIEFLIGGIFIYAGILKILDPVAFARDIDNYKMLKWPMAVALGFYLPWLEILCGLAVIVRRAYRGGLLILTALTVVFILASIIAKARGLDISCGCFGHISKGWSFGKHLAVDLTMLGGLLFLWWQSPVMVGQRGLLDAGPQPSI